MPLQKRRAALRLSPDHQAQLEAISQSRSEPLPRVERARTLLLYAQGTSVSAIARALQTNRPKIERCLDKALQLGSLAALDDLPRSGRPARIPPEARAWLVSVACQKPQDLGYPEELWTTRLLASHLRSHCIAGGHPSLARLARGTVSEILARQTLKVPKIKSYLERRDPDFDRKMAQVLLIYKQVPILQEQEADTIEEPGGAAPDAPLVVSLSHDEKPGIQAIGSVAPDLPLEADKHPSTSRDYECKRHGPLTLMAGLDLLTGRVRRAVVPRHRSREFVAFLKQLDRAYPPGAKLRVVLDNHSARVSQETRAYLATVANRFEFIFTPTHGSWLHLVESFFSNLARTLLRGIRVQSKADLKQRIEASIDRLNEDPGVDRWTYEMDEISVT